MTPVSSQAQTDLREMTEQRDRLEKELLAVSSALDQLQTENKSLEEQVSALLSDRDMVSQQKQETQMKLKTLTEYFEQKEMQLHK